MSPGNAAAIQVEQLMPIPSHIGSREDRARTLCTQKHFDGMKMLVVEVGTDTETGIEGYRLLYQLPGVVDLSSQNTVQWRLRTYVESNFEPCADPSI